MNSRLHISPTALPNAGNEPGLANFFRLMRGEVVEQLSEIAKLAQRIEELRAAGMVPNTLSGEESFRQLATLSRRSARQIEQLTNLGDFLLAPVSGDERLMLDSLIATAAAIVAPQARMNNVGMRIDDGKSLLAPIYGSRRWLETCLVRLLGGLVESAPASAHIHIGLRQVGMHQLMRGSLASHAPSPESRNLLGAGHRFTAGSIGAATTPVELDLAFVHSVISEHGGMFKADLGATGKLHQFTLTLPTGIPKGNDNQTTCKSCPLRQQSLQYASDLADLMARDNATSHPEGDAP